MKQTEKLPAILLLADGTIFYGKSAGKIGTTTGEICFNTGMTGYQEVFTDTSYFGQILVATNAHIGNYGVHNEEVESKSVKIAGLVTKNFTNLFSRKQADGSIQDYFSEQNVVGISDVDTRAVVRHIRSKGAMNAIISSEETDVEKLKVLLAKVPSMEGLELSSKVSVSEAYYKGNPNAKYKVAVLDLGVKENILRCLLERDCYLKVFPANTSHEDMKAWNPDGYMISNGPGDPSAMPAVINTIKSILAENAPLFGICLGHQILAEACGISTYKMHIGHRGINHPVKNLITGKCEITSQNHGFSISKEDIAKSDKIEVTHVNLNDGTIEGFKVKGKNAFSVQYHPESAPGPYDSRYLFDDFVKNLSNVLV
jgi:carbamoyl-phosphate synthase small subunit